MVRCDEEGLTRRPSRRGELLPPRVRLGRRGRRGDRQTWWTLQTLSHDGRCTCRVLEGRGGHLPLPWWRSAKVRARTGRRRPSGSGPRESQTRTLVSLGGSELDGGQWCDRGSSASCWRVRWWVGDPRRSRRLKGNPRLSLSPSPAPAHQKERGKIVSRILGLDVRGKGVGCVLLCAQASRESVWVGLT